MWNGRSTNKRDCTGAASQSRLSGRSTDTYMITDQPSRWTNHPPTHSSSGPQVCVCGSSHPLAGSTFHTPNATASQWHLFSGVLITVARVACCEDRGPTT